MHFKITNNNGTERYVRAKSKAEGAEVEKRLRHVKKISRIKRWQVIEFETVRPEDIFTGEM